jgi:hypothetical protein
VSSLETESIDHWIGTVCALVRSPFDVVQPPGISAVPGPDGDDDVSGSKGRGRHRAQGEDKQRTVRAVRESGSKREEGGSEIVTDASACVSVVPGVCRMLTRLE